jgi:alpha-1,2-mannosyltransferase
MFTCFCYSGLLPSSFSMYAITLAAALVLSGRRHHRATVAVAAFGVLVGWPFAAMAAAPLVVYSLATGGFLQVFCSGLITTICTMVCSKPYLCMCSFSCL